MRTELSSALFPAVTAPSAAELGAFNGGSLTVTWTMPPSLTPGYVSLELGDTNWTNRARATENLGSSDLSKMLTVQPETSTGITFTPVNRQLQVAGRDIYDRRFETVLY